MRKIKIDMFGAILTLNGQGELHSFNERPSRITRSGAISFHRDGFLLKTVYPDGEAIVWSDVEQGGG